MTENPYSSPLSSIDTRPRTRRSKETGNENYFKTARAHLALGCFSLLGVAGVFVALFTGKPLTDHEFTAVLVTGIAVALFTALHFLAWWGAKRRQGWARWLSIAFGLLSLAGFPVGTIIGVYLISLAWKKWQEPEYYELMTVEGWPGQPSS